jgi:hypothetical protein
VVPPRTVQVDAPRDVARVLSCVSVAGYSCPAQQGRSQQQGCTRDRSRPRPAEGKLGVMREQTAGSGQQVTVQVPDWDAAFQD